MVPRKRKSHSPWSRRDFVGGMGATLALTSLGPSANDAQIVCVDAETGAIGWKFLIVPGRKAGGGRWKFRVDL